MPDDAKDITYEINPSAFEWTERIMSALRARLRVNIKLHHAEGQIEAGQIFLFNHFARFETFIPQYLIFKESGAPCRSIAAAEFFKGKDAFARYLASVGGVPNDMPNLLAFLGADLLRGRKLIIFPEGGMVKDRRVLDRKGRYRVYSRSAKERRKHHTGAAALALTLDAFKAGVLYLAARSEWSVLERWAEELKLENAQALVEAACKPTLIVPSNITFYPIRVSENLLQQGAEWFNKGLSKRLYEELLIEGNILLKDTDMDLRLGDAIRASMGWGGWQAALFGRSVRRLTKLEDFFDLSPHHGPIDARLAGHVIRRRVLVIRDRYMADMYEDVTVNLSHLASRLLFEFASKGQMEIDQDLFHRALYLAVRKLRDEGSVHLHRSLLNPDWYMGVPDGQCAGLEQFLSSRAVADLMDREAGKYVILPKLCQEFGFDQIRLENPVAVYANEVAPIAAVHEAVDGAMAEAPGLDEEALARLMFEDEQASYTFNRESFTSGERYAEINAQETATEDGAPYLWLPEDGEGRLPGVLLVHGFLASPAEMRPLAEKLRDRGHPVLAIRLPGHGTSPWDLRGRRWWDWLTAVERGHRILAGLAGSVAVVGFSSGGAVSLLHAAGAPENLVGVAAVAPPMKFRNKNMALVPLVHGVNRMVRKFSPAQKGIMPFRANDTEHPTINYRNMPMRGLYELRRMVHEMEERLVDVTAPVLLVQGTEDPVVDPRGAELIAAKLGSQDKTLHLVPSDRHGIVYENVGDTHVVILDFLDRLAGNGGADDRHPFDESDLGSPPLGAAAE